MGSPDRDPDTTHSAAADDASTSSVAASAEPAAQDADIEQRWRRTLADLENLRKRYAREVEVERAAERSRVVAAWLPVLDNLERALAHDGDQSGGLIAGVRAVRDQAVALLEELGYPRDDETGVRFDPVRHEAVLVAPVSGTEPGTVTDVLRPGYGRGPRQLRPAAVVVAGPPE